MIENNLFLEFFNFVFFKISLLILRLIKMNFFHYHSCVMFVMNSMNIYNF